MGDEKNLSIAPYWHEEEVGTGLIWLGEREAPRDQGQPAQRTLPIREQSWDLEQDAGTGNRLETHTDLKRDSLK